MGERLWSNSFIPMHRWTHVAAIAEGHSLRLYMHKPRSQPRPHALTWHMR